MRPVPLTPLRIERRTIRPGKKVQLVQGSLFADDVEVVRATLLRLREQPVEFAAEPVVGRVRADAAAGSGRSRCIGRGAFTIGTGFWNTVEVSRVGGGWTDPGRPTCGSGWSCRSSPARRPRRSSGWPRPATSATGWRRPSTAGATRASTPTSPSPCTGSRSGEWVGLDSATYPEPNGYGVAESVLHDEGGRIGRGIQTVLVEPL